MMKLRTFLLLYAKAIALVVGRNLDIEISERHRAVLESEPNWITGGNMVENPFKNDHLADLTNKNQENKLTQYQDWATNEDFPTLESNEAIHDPHNEAIQNLPVGLSLLVPLLVLCCLCGVLYAYHSTEWLKNWWKPATDHNTLPQGNSDRRSEHSFKYIAFQDDTTSIKLPQHKCDNSDLYA